MRIKLLLLSLAIVWISKTTIAQTFSKETIEITTSLGSMKVKLFKETPLHRDNFLKLVREHYYDSLLFHRIIQSFMIQGGDPDSKTAGSEKLLGDGDLKYTVPAEFIPTLCHKKGMLCAARNGDDVNPTKASSAAQFYIVQGKVRTDDELKKYEKRINKDVIEKIKLELQGNTEAKNIMDKIVVFKEQKSNDSLIIYNKKLDDFINPLYDKIPHYTFKPEHINLYKTIGGTPHLDSQYTIYGEVIEGLEVIDKIAQLETNKDDRPIIDLRMTVKIVEE